MYILPRLNMLIDNYSPTVYKNIGKPITSDYHTSRCISNILAVSIAFLKFIPNA